MQNQLFLHSETSVTVPTEQDVLEDVESGLVEICATLEKEIESDRMLLLATSDDTGNVDHDQCNCDYWVLYMKTVIMHRKINLSL